MRTCNKKFLIIRNDDIQNLSTNEQEEFLPILQIYPQVFGVIPFASNNKVFTFDDQKLFRVCQINCVKRHRKFDTPYDV